MRETLILNPDRKPLEIAEDSHVSVLISRTTVCLFPLMAMAYRSVLELLEEGLVESEGLDAHETKFEALEHADELFAVDEFDGRHPFASRLASRLCREGPGGENNSFVRSTRHRAAKVAYLHWGDRTRVSLALEEDLEADERIDLQEADSVNTAIAGTTCYRDFLKASFTQEALAESLKASRWKLLESVKDQLPIVCCLDLSFSGRCLCSLILGFTILAPARQGRLTGDFAKHLNRFRV